MEIKHRIPIIDSNANIIVIEFEDGIPFIKIDVAPSEPPIIPIECASYELILNLYNIYIRTPKLKHKLIIVIAVVIIVSIVITFLLFYFLTSSI